MKTRFDNDAYEATHGKSPRGTGLWMFEVVLSGTRGYTDLGQMSAHGTLSQARKKVATEARWTAREVSGISEILIGTLG